MNTVLLVAALVAFAICLVGIVFLVRRSKRAPSEASGAAAGAAATGDTLPDAQARERDGGEVAEGAPEAAPGWRERLAATPPWRLALMGLVAVLTLVVIGVLAGQLGGRPGDDLVVLVAPFDDGGDGQAGRNVAGELAEAIRAASRNTIVVSVAGTRPATPEEALAAAAQAGADVLIWGDVEPGAILDSPSLSPRLIYTPTGAYGPNAWEGYLGRFAMPRSYTLAREPINGRAVVVPLVLALADYASGAPDAAYNRLGRLLEDYPALNEPLPRALRGNILWARTFYAEAAQEYRRALAVPSDEQSLLANNLGAILLDAGEREYGQALTAFQEAVRLLEGRDLGELRYNLATLALREGRAADAAVALEQARNLMPPSAPMLLDLTRAYRDTGRLGEAAETLRAAELQARDDMRNVPAEYAPMTRERYEAALDEQDALLDLATQIGARGDLLWELDVAPTPPVNVLGDLRRRLDIAAETSDTRVAGWRKQATSDSAARSDAGLVATGQAELAEQSADRQRFYQAVVETELSRARGASPRSTLGALFTGQGEANPQFALLETLRGRYPRNAQITNALGRARRIAGQLDTADADFDSTVSLMPQAPEGYFGKGTVARARGNPQQAADLFNLALQRNAAFFPSHYELAAMAEEAGDYAAAAAQRRAIYALRPGPASAVALARDLRRSGPAGFGEAEQVLQPLSATSAEAAVELGRLYNEAGRREAAIGAYQEALRLDPGSSAAAFELGETYVALQDYAQAEQYLNQAVRLDADNVDARLALADLYQGPLDDRQRAESEYRQALNTGVNNTAELIKIGDAAFAAGNYAQAIKAYGDAARIDPNNALFHHKLGSAYFAAGRLQAAAEQENLALTLTGDPGLRAEALVVLGDVARLSGDMVGATNDYTQALQLNPNLIDAELGLGLVAVGQGNWGVATGYFQTAAAMPGGADNPAAQFWLGEALLRQRDFVGATAAYNRAIALRENFPEAYLGLAQVQHAQGGQNPAQTALATVNSAIRLRPTYAEGLLFRGKMLQELGRTDEASAAYSASISADNRIAESHFRRGILELRASRYNAAVRDFREATQLQPNFPEAFYWLGRSYYAQGDNERALEAFRQAVALNGNYAEAVFYVGLVSEDLGRTAEAISAYQTVIAIDPNGELAGRARAQIDRLS
jgi:tetratricopeptide (TPR) repeat protein